MKKIIKNYIDFMNKYVLVKAGTVLLILVILSKIFTVINDVVNNKNVNINTESTYISQNLTNDVYNN